LDKLKVTHKRHRMGSRVKSDVL